MPDTTALDNFETLLRDGLVKICRGAGLLGQGRLPSCPDIADKWEKEFIKDYVADAVANFNDYPEVAIAWAGFLGMGVAHHWDRNWAAHSANTYSKYYGERGFDDMDEHIMWDVLHIKKDFGAKISETLASCAAATLALIRHQGIEPQTAEGFYTLVRAYGVLYEIGAAIELCRLGYKMVAAGRTNLSRLH